LSHIATQGQMPSACGPILLQKWLLETPPASPPRNQRQTTWQYRAEASQPDTISTRKLPRRRKARRREVWCQSL
ncbi:hypothetical protein M8037_23455, partial [Sinorhizobium meliloti]|uniref:hypothetical protein n=1 Tax=Rhizobium meliloti TaxID=382 RepID=UPI002073055D